MPYRIGCRRSGSEDTLLTKYELKKAAQYLAARDDDLARLLEADGFPPLWARKQSFGALVQIILEQQVSLASAAAVYKRLKNNLKPFSPRRFLNAGPDYLRSLGVTRQKAGYCINVAEAILKKQLVLRSLPAKSDRDVFEILTRIKGIGPWTANIYLLMVLCRPDIWPPGDIALINTLRKVKGLGKKPSPSVLLNITNTWRPYRAVAARMLWHHYLSVR